MIQIIFLVSVFVGCSISISTLSGAEQTAMETIDTTTGWKIVTASCGKTTIRLLPEAGCNLFSIIHDGTEILGQAPTTKDIAGFHFGNPVLYPSPNRVKDSRFTFGGKEYRFTPNDGPNFLHGIVHSSRWELTSITKGVDSVTLHCQLKFEPGKTEYQLFPHRHLLKYNVTVRDGAVQCEFTVDNSQGSDAIPFGFALHPWFLYQGTRAETWLTVPAQQHMELDPSRPNELLPSGQLTAVSGSRFDALQGRSLEGWIVDDVWFGMKPEAPALIDFRDKKLKISMRSSAEFTHLVVYTPEDQPWFCVENQTCSTDAHNLHGKGVRDEAHLLIVPPGKSRSGQVEYRFERY